MTVRKNVLAMRESIINDSPDHIGINVKQVFSSRSSEEFDKEFSIKLYGFPSVTEFYNKISW